MNKFSVLLSVYFREKPEYLDLALKSIHEQTLKPDEIVLVKDGLLTKELEVIIQKYVDVRVVTLAQNVGLGKALNEGLKSCSYEIVARMDTDDIAKCDRFEKQMAIIDNNPDVDVVSAWVNEFEGTIFNVLSTRKLPEKHEMIYDFAKSRNPINHPVVMFKKKAVLAAGGYQHFPLFEDYYLWVRMLMNGAKFYNIQEGLLFFRFSSDMFKRRGGWKYALDEYRFQNTIRKIGFISFPKFIKNVMFRFGIRIAPNILRIQIYKLLLRK